MTTTDGVQIPLEGVALRADVSVPDRSRGIVVFAHGSGSSRLSPRNRAVAIELQRAKLGTVLVDLLTRSEEVIDAATAELRFDIDLLAERLVGVIDWVTTELAGDTGIGLFGASTGAAAAIVAALERPTVVKAIVSRGGRPDLAADALRWVRQPTLLIVGGEDPAVIEINRRALALLPGKTQIVIIPGASHLFEEPGALDQVAHLARDWFVDHLRPAARVRGR